MNGTEQMLEDFLDGWPESSDRNKQAFLRLKEHLADQEDVSLGFEQRPEITSSLRAAHGNQAARPLFVMVDVIEDRPRWLSVCFYADLISDPEERGDKIPGGLLGEDALCFDLESYDEKALEYILARMDEALTGLRASG